MAISRHGAYLVPQLVLGSVISDTLRQPVAIAYCFGRKFPKLPSILTRIADDIRICFTVVIQNPPPMEQVTMRGGI